MKTHTELKRALKEAVENLENYRARSRKAWQAAFQADVDEAAKQGRIHALGGTREPAGNEARFLIQEQVNEADLKARIETLEWVLGQEPKS